MTTLKFFAFPESAQKQGKSPFLLFKIIGILVLVVFSNVFTNSKTDNGLFVPILKTSYEIKSFLSIQ